MLVIIGEGFAKKEKMNVFLKVLLKVKKVKRGILKEKIVTSIKVAW